jgi:hypothetical protein
MRSSTFALLALLGPACGGQVDGISPPASEKAPEPAPPAGGGEPRPTPPPMPWSGPTEAELDRRCRELETVSSRFEAPTIAELEKRLAGTWYACEGAPAMTSLFPLSDHPTRLGTRRGFAVRGTQVWPLDVYGQGPHTVDCLECSIPWKAIDPQRVLFGGDELRVGFIGGSRGLVVARTDTPTTLSLFAFADY